MEKTVEVLPFSRNSHLPLTLVSSARHLNEAIDERNHQLGVRAVGLVACASGNMNNESENIEKEAL